MASSNSTARKSGITKPARNNTKPPGSKAANLAWKNTSPLTARNYGCATITPTEAWSGSPSGPTAQKNLNPTGKALGLKASLPTGTTKASWSAPSPSKTDVIPQPTPPRWATIEPRFHFAICTLHSAFKTSVASVAPVTTPINIGPFASQTRPKPVPAILHP